MKTMRPGSQPSPEALNCAQKTHDLNLKYTHLSFSMLYSLQVLESERNDSLAWKSVKLGEEPSQEALGVDPAAEGEEREARDRPMTDEPGA